MPLTKLLESPASQENYYLRRLASRDSSYPVPVTPYEDECLEDLLVRAACMNGLHPLTPYRDLGISRVTLARTCGTATRWNVTSIAISNLIGNRGGAKEIEALIWDKEPLQSKRVRFFSTDVQGRTLTYRRRVSPRALAQKPYLRAIWRVSAINFDPETKEYLLEKCPEPKCGRTLGFGFMGDIWCCDQCSSLDEHGQLKAVDLRDYKQPLVNDSLWTALDYATCFIDPLATDKLSRARADLHDDFQGLSNGDIFDFITALAQYTSPRRVEPGRSSKTLPEELARAASTLAGWPSSFEKFALEHPGMGSSTHPLRLWLIRHPRYHVVHDRVKITSELVRGKSRQRPVNPAPPASLIGKSPSQEFTFDAAALQLPALSKSLHYRDDVISFARRLGVALPTLLDLADGDTLPTALLAQSMESFGKISQRFVARLEEGKQTAKMPSNSVRLSKAVMALHRQLHDPWPKIIRALLNGRLPYWLLGGVPPYLTGLKIADFDILQDILAEPFVSPTPQKELRMTLREGARFTNQPYEVLAEAKRAGMIDVPLTRTSLHRFSSTFESLDSILLRLRLKGQTIKVADVRAKLIDAGIYPVITFKRYNDLWARSAVDACFGLRIALGVSKPRSTRA